LLVVAAFAPAAQAATVSLDRSDDLDYVHVHGGHEADRLTVSSPAPDVYVVTQGAGLPLSASGSGCAVSGAGRVTCHASSLDGVYAHGEDGDDTIAVQGAVGRGSLLRGGPGNDKLTGGAGTDQLDGEDGDDCTPATVAATR
jgi:Ca2+-binding RTX toxin-like protein